MGDSRPTAVILHQQRSSVPFTVCLSNWWGRPTILRQSHTVKIL